MLAAARLYTLSVEARSGSLAAHCLVGGIPQPRGSPSFLWRDNPASANWLQGRVISGGNLVSPRVFDTLSLVAPWPADVRATGFKLRRLLGRQSVCLPSVLARDWGPLDGNINQLLGLSVLAISAG